MLSYEFRKSLYPTHGDELIDLPDKDSVTMRNHIAEIADRDDSDVIVIISPHGMTIKDHIASCVPASVKSDGLA